ncbi:MAG: hypothetical protein HYU39_00860 [Thaumarchaeota archaeon]|nr:hypothetical protein [Nitrososphaerota archaeon]
MPRLVESEEEFLRWAGKASGCRVVRRGDEVKIKLRTPGFLAVYVTSGDKADGILEQIKVEKVEI